MLSTFAHKKKCRNLTVLIHPKPPCTVQQGSDGVPILSGWFLAGEAQVIGE
jgi:hypothetical protein